MLWNGWPMAANAHPTRPWWQLGREGGGAAVNSFVYTRIDGLWRVEASWYWDRLKVEQFSAEYVKEINVASIRGAPTRSPSPGRPCWQPIVDTGLHHGLVYGATPQDARAAEDNAILQWMEKVDKELGPRPRPKIRCGQVWRWPHVGWEEQIGATDAEDVGFSVDVCGQVHRQKGDDLESSKAVLVADLAGEAPWEKP